MRANCGPRSRFKGHAPRQDLDLQFAWSVHSHGDPSGSWRLLFLIMQSTRDLMTIVMRSLHRVIELLCLTL